MAKAGVPSASGISSTPASAPKVVSGCAGPSMSRSRWPTMPSFERRGRMHGAVRVGRRDVAHAGDDHAVGIGDEQTVRPGARSQAGLRRSSSLCEAAVEIGLLAARAIDAARPGRRRRLRAAWTMSATAWRR